MVKALVALMLTSMVCSGMPVQSQTIISESGRLIYFNSLDSARAATINSLSALANCWIWNFDPRDSFPILLDLRPDIADTGARDTAAHDGGAPQLGYDNLFGNSMSFIDSAIAPTDPGQLRYYRLLGLRIRLIPADPSSDPKILLQLLEYGIANYKMLARIRTLCLADGSGPGALTLVPQDIARILARPPSQQIRLALRSCH